MGAFKHLTFTSRIMLEKCLKQNMPVTEIAKILGVHRSTIYREKKRGRYTHLNTELIEEERYSPDIAEKKYRYNLKSKGSDLKIGKDLEYANYIEEKIINNNYSPEAVLGEIKNKNLKFKTSVSKTTLYKYIDKNVFFRLTNKDLPVKPNKKRAYKKVRVQAKANVGTSIEKRDESVKTREEFGHWEMDTVIGKKGVSKNSLLVLTERKTRMEYIFKLKEHTAKEVVKCIDELEEIYKNKFSNTFKTITVDNGTEFSDCIGIEKSILSIKKRTNLYYCHAYCSYERGSNENQNKLIRRHIPKGTNFDDYKIEQIKEIEDWINDYPRKIFNYKTARMMFEEEIKKIS